MYDNTINHATASKIIKAVRVFEYTSVAFSYISHLVTKLSKWNNSRCNDEYQISAI